MLIPFFTFIQSVITSHTCVAPRLVITAHDKSAPHSSLSSRPGLLCSDALYAALFISLCIGLIDKEINDCESIGKRL